MSQHDDAGITGAPHDSDTLPAQPQTEKISERLSKLGQAMPQRVPAPASAVVLLPLAPGEILGHYRILDHLGRGGMGYIHRALDLHLEREVALKVASERIAADVEGPLREARALASLNHPNVVTVYELGVDEGRAYIVMELLRGETLRARMQRTPPSLVEALSWACDLLRGLMAVHSARLVHLDIKPENLFLTAEGPLKILDFGIARLIRTGTFDPGTVAGTIAYMAPEQVLGDAFDFRADLFAFGVVLHELLTGKHPFIRPHFGATMVALVQGDYFKDALFSDAEVESIVRDCMALEPADRPPSAAQVLERVERALKARTQVGARSEVAYAETEHGNVAFQCIGSARGADLLLLPGMLSRFDMWTHEPEGAALLRALANAGRVILFDRCGFGASDRVSDASLPQPDDEVDHIDAVLDGAGSRRAVLLAIGEGAPLAALYAAVRPERVAGLVIYGGAASHADAGALDRLADRAEHWGTERGAALSAPSWASDARLVKWLSSWERMTASPRVARASTLSIGRTDVRPVLPFIRCPTLVLHRKDDGWCPPEASAAFVDAIAGAKREILPGHDHFPCAGPGDIAPHVARFIREHEGAPTDEAHSLATWLVTDMRVALLPARLRPHIALERGSIRLVRLDRPGAGARLLRTTFARSPAQARALIGCSERSASPDAVLAELEPSFVQARPGVVAATPVARAIIEGTAGIVLDARAKPGGERALEAGSEGPREAVEDVAPLAHRSFSVRAEPGPLLRIEGSIMLKDPERLLFPHFRRIHECAVGCGRLVVDVRRLAQINSAALGMFIRWVGWIQAELEDRRYRLVMHADPAVLWQRANLLPLQMIAPDVIEVVTPDEP